MHQYQDGEENINEKEVGPRPGCEARHRGDVGGLYQRVKTPNPALFLARLTDLARSNAFLWTEAGLSVQEHTTRMVPVGQSLSRSLVMATVAADIFVGYTTLNEREKWLPSLVKPRDWELQHQRSANRVLETAASLGGALIKACQFASTRPDLLPAVYIRTLAPLQDRIATALLV